MLFGYPVEATIENWFHECMKEIIQTIHNNLRNGQPLPAWPELIPEDYRNDLSRKTGLRDRLVDYQTAVAKLTQDEQNRVLIALQEQNNIEQLLSGDCSCDALDSLPERVHQPIRALYYFGFELLSDLGIRDRQYEVIYGATPFHICPFCGFEYFDGPTAPRREPLDHYLAKSKYPFAAINPKNLVPMGGKCNSKYKLAQDILFKEDGTRRRAINPYASPRIQISLLNSRPFEGTSSIFPLPLWQIEFEPNTEEVSTWDSVFDIKERYRRDILDADFLTLLREFSIYCKDRRVRADSLPVIIQALHDFAEYWREMGMKDKAFIKAAFFDMLFYHCNAGNQRLCEIVGSVVLGGMSLSP